MPSEISVNAVKSPCHTARPDPTENSIGLVYTESGS